ncbi:MAG TPA: condensation domain-containing protein, partial [Longimicrobiaceae bacterium]|nr:condensation domain-containing protein [Longimicrobiaceae bacterium]
MAYPATEPDGVVLAPLSPAQQRLWIVHRMDPTGPLYNVAHLLRLRGRLDVAVLEHALAEVVRRHDVLRTTFAERGGEPVQVIAPQRLVREILQVRSMEAHPPALREPAALREAAAEAWRRFDLERGPLCRLLLFPLSAEENLLLVVMHHLVSDGWSLNVLFRELSTFYNASLHGRPAHLPELPMQYAGLSGWERERMQGERFREDLAYWKRRLAGIPPVLDLSVGRPRPPVQRFRGERLPLREAGDLLERARSQARALGATSFEFLLAAYAALLGVYCGHEDVVIGVPMAGRTDPRLRPLIGFFVNTVVLRVDLSGDPPFDELVRRASAVAREAREHQDVPFHRLVEELQPERSPSYTPLVQVFFVKHSPQTRADASLLEGIEATELLLPGRESLFDLTLTIDEERSHAEYDADLLDAETVGRLLEHYRAVVEAAVADPRRRCSELLSPGGADREVVLSGRRAAALASRPLRCVHEIFSEQAGRTPDAVALVSRPERLTYARLERRANRLAHLLRRRGVAPEVRVGVCLERSPDLIVSLLAV